MSPLSAMKFRTISLPGHHDVVITPIKSLLHTAAVQKMRSRAQLDVARFTFPLANHSRFAHSLSTYQLTVERTRKWLQQGIISEEDALNLTLFALLHDIGHDPYSHAIEELCQIDHNENGIRLLAELSKEIEQASGCVETITKLFRHENPLHAAVSDRPLGTDKLSYLYLDARMTNEAISIPLGHFLNYVYFIDDHLVIELKIINEMMRLQQDYFYMYARVYFKRSCLATKRMLQKMVSLLLQQNELTEDELWQMVDGELDAKFFRSKNAVVREMAVSLFHKRRIPKAAVVFRPRPFVYLEAIGKRPIVVHSTTEQELYDLEYLRNPKRALAAEAEIAQALELPEDCVFLVFGAPQKRFNLPDVHVYDRGQSVGMISDFFPNHTKALEEFAKSQVAVRICTYDDYRAKLAYPKNAEMAVHKLFEICSREN